MKISKGLRFDLSMDDLEVFSAVLIVRHSEYSVPFAIYIVFSLNLPCVIVG